MTVEFLKAGTPLVAAVVDWLSKRIMTTKAGVLSLEHIMVIVPTRQSGRNLRLALAGKFEGNGVLSPFVTLPSRLAVPADNTLRTASSCEIAAALVQFFAQKEIQVAQWENLFPKGFSKEADNVPSVISLADQLEDIWSALGAKGLLMKDVLQNEAASGIITEALGNEIGRWEDLSDFETKFFEFLNSKGLRHHSQALNMAKSAPAPLPDGITTIVLPGLADPIPVLYDVIDAHVAANPSLSVNVLIHAEEKDAVKFDRWGRPNVESWTGEKAPALELNDNDIVISSNTAALAGEVANNFPVPGTEAELPSLGLADAELYPSIEAALLSRGYCEIHNPERHMLAASSLGHIVSNLVALLTDKPVRFETFAALLRENDILAALKPLRRSLILKELDQYQNDYIPVSMPIDIDEKIKKQETGEEKYLYPELRAAHAKLVEWRKIKAESVPDAVLGILREIFASRNVGDQPGDREFVAATEAMRGVFAELNRPIVVELDANARLSVFQKTLSKAAYQLEPESSDVIKTEGWLELAWSSASNIIIAGMTEGKVPDSVVGHAFLPDKLREALGIESNVRRLARDTYLFSELLASRGNGGRVKAFVSLADGNGDLQRPSRLLFLCGPDKLPARVKRLFGEPDAPAMTPSRVLPPEWRLAFPLEVPPAPDHLSASAMDVYLKCPFTYFLKNVLKMEPYREIEELESSGFGNFCHEVLSDFGNDKSVRDLTDEEEIRQGLLRHFEARAVKFGSSPSANLVLQLESAKERILSFAPVQAAQRAAGWRIEECERRIDNVKPFADFDITVKGFIDRIDYNEQNDTYCIIDYKTWEDVAKAKDKIVSKSTKELEFAQKLGLPVFEVTEISRGKEVAVEYRWLTVQMAVYRELLEGSNDKYHGKIKEYKYAVIGKSADDTGFFGGGDGGLDIAASISSARETMHRVFELISAGIFWPPGVSDLWKWDYARLFLTNPSADYGDSEWVKFQEQLLEKTETFCW